MKIFISIASYRDPLLTYTLTEAYNNAVHKDNLFFGIVEQANPEEAIDTNSFTFNKQIRYVRIDPLQSGGCCWARSLAQSFYNGEDFFFQIDSHMGFDSGWDTWFINSMQELMKYHKKPIITGYPQAIAALNDDIITNPIVKQSKEDQSGMFALIAGKAECFIDNYYISTHSHWIKTDENFLHGYLLSANTLFTIGSSIEEVPYDPFLFFSGEEHSLALRYWTHGYNIFHGKNLPTYHYYSRGYRKVFWDPNDDPSRPIKWWELDVRSKNRLKEIVTGNLKGIYGIGTERFLKDYMRLTGIKYDLGFCEPCAYDGSNIFSRNYRENLTYSKTSSGIPPIPRRISTPDIRKRLTNN